MKAFFTVLLTVLSVKAGAAQATPRAEIPRQIVGNIAFYVIPESKQIWLELPYHLKGSVISVDNQHMLNIFAQTDKNLDREDVRAIRKQYPGYKLREAAVINKESVDVDLGISKKINLSEDPSGHAGFFSAEVQLTSNEASALKSKIRAQQWPTMQLVVRRSVPQERILELIELPTRRICDQLVQASGNQSVKFARGFSLLLSTIAPELKKLENQSLIDQAVELVVDTCIVPEIDSESKLGRVPMSFSSKNANRSDLLKISKIEEVPATVSATIEGEWSIL